MIRRDNSRELKKGSIKTLIGDGLRMLRGKRDSKAKLKKGSIKTLISDGLKMLRDKKDSKAKLSKLEDRLQKVKDEMDELQEKIKEYGDVREEIMPSVYPYSLDPFTVYGMTQIRLERKEKTLSKKIEKMKRYQTL